MLVLVVGPSGAGKDTLLNAARVRLADDANVRFAQREVTRPPTPGGEDHLPIDAATYAEIPAPIHCGGKPMASATASPPRLPTISHVASPWSPASPAR